jgi:cytoskeleton protein RodZ
MRAYAKLLEIDPEPLLASLRFAGGETAPPLTITRDPTTNTPGISPRTLTIGAMALVAVLFLIMVFSVFDDETASDDTPDREVAEEAEVPDAGASDEVTTLAPDPQAAAADDLIPVLEPSEDVPTSAASVAQAGAEPAEVDLPGLRRLMPDGDDRLSLKFTEECWVEIKNPQGRVLYGGLGTPGQTLDFVGRGPFHILLGYAPGASLRFNFETVALAPHTRQDVASLVLGQ